MARVNQHPHQSTNVDGWCTDRILFSIPVPSQVDFFCLPFLGRDQPWSQFFFGTFIFYPGFPVLFFLDLGFFFRNFIFSPPPTQFLFFFFFSFFFFAFETFPTHPPTYPLSIYLPTCLPTFLPTNTLSTYLPNSTYMATPTYLVATPIDP